ncbi:MAG: glycosyltransferase [Planctomycetota bacterium]|jgi:glycosyltransferase involved in cell wall biosynthesis
MRVLTFTTLFPNAAQPNKGVFVLGRTKRVASYCDIEVVAPLPAAPPLPGLKRGRELANVPDVETIDGLRVHHPRYLALPGRWPRLKPRSIANGAWATIARLHAERPFDLVDAHFAHPDGVAAARIAHRLGRPLVLSLRGSDIHRDLHDPRLRSVILETARAADAVIAVSQNLADEIVDAGHAAENVRVIPNGVDSTRFSPMEQAEARREIDAGDGPLILAVAALVPVKGVDTLLEAFARGPATTRLWIAGDGPLRGEYEALAQRLGVAERVRFLGAVPHAALRAHYAAADLFVLPSRNEGCPNALLEALSCGCPAVATRVGHAPSLVTDGVNGVLAEPGDVESLAGAIERAGTVAFENDRVRASVRDLSWERVAMRVAEVFEAVRSQPKELAPA